MRRNLLSASLPLLALIAAISAFGFSEPSSSAPNANARIQDHYRRYPLQATMHDGLFGLKAACRSCLVEVRADRWTEVDGDGRAPVGVAFDIVETDSDEVVVTALPTASIEAFDFYVLLDDGRRDAVEEVRWTVFGRFLADGTFEPKSWADFACASPGVSCGFGDDGTITEINLNLPIAENQ